MVAAQREMEVAKVNAEREACCSNYRSTTLISVLIPLTLLGETNVSFIRLQQEVKEKENEAKKTMIETQMVVDKTRLQASGNSYTLYSVQQES